MTLRAPLPIKKWWPERHFASLYPSRLSLARKIHRPIFLHLAPKRQWLSIILPLFARYFSPSRGYLSPFSHCIFLQWTCCLLHFALRFAAFYLAFWCFLHCVLVHFTLRFGAFCIAFWCILPCVLVQFAPNYAVKGVLCCVGRIFKQCSMVIYPPLCAPCFAPNKLVQYSQKCGRTAELP